MTATVEAHKETLNFQTEVKQLLHLMIHSLYSNKEIFLRELISNASDACDKLRFEALSDDALYDGDSELKVKVTYDKEAKTVTIADNGTGMSRAEVVDNIGTIAKSGTRRFFESLTGDQAEDAQLIGQFGVGFYSAYIVADKVTLVTRRAGLGAEHGVRWESAGEGDYSIETVEKPTRGTEITLHLKKDEDEFLQGYRLRSVISKYSDHISVPIMMDSEEEDKKEEETVNKASALWTRPKKDIKEEEYHEFYKHVTHDFEDPLSYVHSRVEGNQSYTSLLFIPARAPFDLWDRDRQHGIKLYVKRVFIMDEAEHLMPNYLRFVRGIVDSDDLPLNISREILQRNRQIDTIRGASVKKVLSLLENFAKNDQAKYKTFWKEFGRALKEGPGEDFANKGRIATLLRFSSTHDDDKEQNVSLEDYVARMKTGQDKIYYVSADTYMAAKHSPHLEVFHKKGIEVLLMFDRVDEWLMNHLTEFDAKSFQSVAKGDLDLGSLEDQTDKEEREKAAAAVTGLAERMKAVLGDKVTDVRITHRLTDSPSCLVVEEQDMAANLQRMLKAAGHEVPSSKPTMEINPGHLLVKRLNHEKDDNKFADWTEILFDQALLAEGGQLDDPAAFVAKLNHQLTSIVFLDK